MPAPFVARLAERPLLCDGATGTVLDARGVSLDTCFDVLCVNDPEVVQGMGDMSGPI
jgi:homocysteine S-methyltransferase